MENREIVNVPSENLENAIVVLDREIYFYGRKVQKGNYFPNLHTANRHPPLGAGKKLYMPHRRIIVLKNPNLIIKMTGDPLIYKHRENSNNGHAKIEIITPEDYETQHQSFLSEIGDYGFIRGGPKTISVLQELVDKECEIAEKVLSNYK